MRLASLTKDNIEQAQTMYDSLLSKVHDIIDKLSQIQVPEFVEE